MREFFGKTAVQVIRERESEFQGELCLLSLLLVPELLLLRDFVQEFIRSLPFSQATEAGPSRAGARFGPGLSARLSGLLALF